jgi:hypothetical protein
MVRKSAFTLIELLVYIAIMGFIIVVAGRVFSDSTTMRVRSQNMLKTAETVGKVSSLLKEDISQMGTKVGGYEAANVYTVNAVDPKIYWDVADNDLSSYALIHRPSQGGNASFDSIVFRKAVFDDQGKYIAIREIAWAAREENGRSQLFRRCATVLQCSGTACGIDNDLSVCPVVDNVDAAEVVPVLVAENVVNFRLTPSTPGMAGNTQETLFPDPLSLNSNFKLLPRTPDGSEVMNLNVNNSGTEAIVATFSAKNSDKTGKLFNQLYLAGEGVSSWGDCELFQFIKGEIYAIEFNMPFKLLGNSADSQSVFNSTQFLPGMDHLAVGLRTSAGNEIPDAPNDVLFYPAQSADAASLTRHAEFSVKENIDACVALTFAFYSPKASGGKLVFSNFKVLRKSDKTFHFLRDGDTDYDENYGTEAIANIADKIKQKTNAKAFELALEIEHRGERAGTFSSNRNGMAITTPNNGVIANNIPP